MNAIYRPHTASSRNAPSVGLAKGCGQPITRQNEGQGEDSLVTELKRSISLETCPDPVLNRSSFGGGTAQPRWPASSEPLHRVMGKMGV